MWAKKCPNFGEAVSINLKIGNFFPLPQRRQSSKLFVNKFDSKLTLFEVEAFFSVGVYYQKSNSRGNLAYICFSSRLQHVAKNVMTHMRIQYMTNI